jgi:flagellar biosynthesis/type III secretory pathway M-ring protein FliF/YscJ
VTASAGIVESRGDVLTIENLPFEAPPAIDLRETGPTALRPAPGVDWRQVFTKEWLRQHRYTVIGAVVGFLVLAAALVLGLRKTANMKKVVAAASAVVASQAQEIEKQLADRQIAQQHADEAALLELTMPQVTSNKAMLLKKLLADNAKKDASSTVQLLRSWIHEDER